MGTFKCEFCELGDSVDNIIERNVSSIMVVLCEECYNYIMSVKYGVEHERGVKRL